MKVKNITLLFALLFISLSWGQNNNNSNNDSGLLNSFKDGAEWHEDFAQDNLVGWTSLDLDGLNTAGPFQDFPGKGGPLGFIVYNPSQTDPINTLDAYIPYAGKKYFVSISSYDGPSNDWLISDELADHPGGVFSFYAKSSFTYSGEDEFKVAYSTTGDNPEDFIFLNNGNTISPSTVWSKFEYEIPADAKHLAINCVSEAVMLLVDNIEFVVDVEPEAPGVITDLSFDTELGDEIQTTLNWINPTVDEAGNTLDNMTGVKVFRGTHPMNLTEIADLPSAAGENMTYVDNLPESGFYTHRLVPYNDSGDGVIYTTPVTFFGYESIPGAATNITFSQDENLHTVISWDEVDYGSLGGSLENPVVGYTIIRSFGDIEETLATMHSSTTFTETDIPDLYLYTYSIIAQTSEDDLGVPAITSAYSGLGEDQKSVTTGVQIDDQPFELSRSSIISQSIYTPEDLGDGGLITSLSYFANLGTTSTAHYKIYMSMSDRSTFGTTLDNAVWEFFGDQQLVFDGDINFPSGRNAITIDLDQPFYYDDTNNDNVIITIVKPLLEPVPSVNPREFYNTTVDDMRTYAAVGYSVDLSLISTQPASWATDEYATIPSIVVGKATDFGSLTGTVTALSDSSPLEGVTVTISPDDDDAYQTVTTTTDETGVYNISALLPGDYVVTFTKDEFNPYETNLTIEASEQHTLDAILDSSLPILISGTVVDADGDGIEGVTMTLTGFSDFTTLSDVDGNYVLEAFAEKSYSLEAFHPLYLTESTSFTSDEEDYTLAQITLNIAAHKPRNIIAVNNDGVGDVSWDTPVGLFNETQIGWGSFITAGDAWGNGVAAFMAGIRFETSDLENQIVEDAELTHVRAYIANNAEINIKVFEGQNAAELLHSQSASIQEEGWYVFELTASLPINTNKELWIGLEFLEGEYGPFPMGLDDGPNAPDQKGSMKYENGVWTPMSLTNKNWNIYGIVNNTMEADPSGYMVYRSPASANDWTELTADAITATNYSDETLDSAPADMYEYGITALYGDNEVSDKGISNEIEHHMFFDFTVELVPDFGNAEGAYISVWNSDNFAEGFFPASNNSFTFNDLTHGDYNLRVELENYEILELTDVAVNVENNTITAPLTLRKVQPSNLIATAVDGSPSSITLDWTLHATYTDQIEKYEDFERENIEDYILKDLDGLETYIYNNFDWPDAGIPMSFMVFNPHSTLPPILSMDAFSGRRFLTAFAGPNGANNDWLIIPAGSGDFSFMAASVVDNDPEKIQVLYSTTGSDVSDFTAFDSEITVPGVWTEYSFEAPAETKYVAINYTSNGTYILKIDDLTYEKEYDHALSYNIYLDGQLISDNVTETTFTLQDLDMETHIAEVEAVYETGLSEKTEVEITLMNIENHKISKFNIYPNPTTGRFSIELNNRATVNIRDMQGRLLYSGIKEAGTSIMEHSFSSGTYIIQIQTEKGVFSKKIIFL